MEVLKLDFGRVANPIIEQAMGLKRDTLTRVVHIALPYLNFDPRIGKFAHLTMGGLDTLQNVCSLPLLLSSEKIAERVVRIAMTASSTALLILAPHISTQISFAMGVLSNSSEACWGAYNHDYQTAFYATLKALGFSIQYAALVYSSTGMIATSLLVSCAQYLAQAYNEFNHDENSWLQLIEAASHTLLAANTLRTATPMLKELYTNYGKQQLTQEQWHTFLDKMEPTTEEKNKSKVDIDFEKKLSQYLEEHTDKITIKESDQKFAVRMSDFLKEMNLSTTLTNLNLKYLDHSKLLWDGIRFENCNLTYIYFSRSRFENVVFDQCTMNDTEFKRSELVNTLFQNMSLEGVVLEDCSGKGVKVFNCTNAQSFLNCGFVDSQFKKCQFLLANLTQEKGEGLEFDDCYFEDPISLAGVAKTNCFISGLEKTPLAFPAYESESMGVFANHIQKVLSRNGARTVLCPREIKTMTSKLKDQVETLLKEYDPESGISRTQFLFAHARADSPITKVYDVAYKVIKATQGVVLPGGPNVCSALYKPCEKADFDNLGQSIMEAAYVIAAGKLNKPVMGLCRGHQLIAVVYGGTLKNTENGSGFQHLHVTDKLSQFARKFFAPIIEHGRAVGYSAHEQAIDIMPKGFEEVMRYRDVVKAMTKDGRVIGSQVHPEVIEELDESYRFITKMAPHLQTPSLRNAVIKALSNLSSEDQNTVLAQLQPFMSYLSFDPKGQEELYRNFIRLAENAG